MDTPNQHLSEPQAQVPGVTSPTTPQERRFAFRILMLSSFCLGLGQTILFALLPPIARELGFADIQVGLIFSVSALLWFLTSPRWGRLSDRTGRKRIILLGVSAFAISLSAFALVLAFGLSGGLPPLLCFGLLLLARAGHGGVSSAAPAASQAYIADRTTPAERTANLASLSAAFGLGATVGPGLAGFAAAFGPVAPLFGVSLVAVTALCLIARFLPERTPPRDRAARARLRFSDPRLRALLAFGFVGGIVFAVPKQLLGFYLIDRLALDAAGATAALGLIFTLSSLMALFAQLVIIQRLRVPTAILLRIAPPILVIGHLTVGLTDHLPVIVGAMMLTGLGNGMFLPAFNGAISLSISPEEQGNAAGLGSSMTALALIFTPSIAFTVYKLAPSVPFFLSAALAGAMALSAPIVTRRISGK